MKHLIANDIVSVQPMSLPAGLLFYLDYTYGRLVAPSLFSIVKKIQEKHKE